jgi:hypothetical protein
LIRTFVDKQNSAASVAWNSAGSDIMETEKNLHAAIPAALLIKAEATAKALCITLDELVEQAIEDYLAYRADKKNAAA